LSLGKRKQKKLFFFVARKVTGDGRNRLPEILAAMADGGRRLAASEGRGGWLWLLLAVPNLKEQLGCDALGPMYGLKSMNLVDKVELSRFNGRI
jgi:hypothetical protein